MGEGSFVGDLRIGFELARACVVVLFVSRWYHLSLRRPFIFDLYACHKIQVCKDDRDIAHPHFPRGGGRSHVFSFAEISPYIIKGNTGDADNAFKFVAHGKYAYDDYNDSGFIRTNVPLDKIIGHLSVRNILEIGKLHGLDVSSHMSKSRMVSCFVSHHCLSCGDSVTIFSVIKCKSSRNRDIKRRLVIEQRGVSKEQNDTAVEVVDNIAKGDRVRVKSSAHSPGVFPPLPPDEGLMCDIIRVFCRKTSRENVEEAGCAVCGQLTLSSRLSRLKHMKQYLHVLNTDGITRIERKDSNTPVRGFKGPVLDYQCDMICETCRKHIRNGQVPRNALANGLWLGAVPIELSTLNFVERMLIARVRVNSCFVRVAASGLKKMTSHVIAFESPVPKVYHRLPPPVEDMEDILAILFTGPCTPTEKDYVRAPVLVRRSFVARALEWLKVNNIYYADLDVAYDELMRYPETIPPVSVEYRHSLTTKTEEGTSSFDNGEGEGVEDGECPFVVHGLMGDQYQTMSVEELKGIALMHWNNGGGALAVSHGASSKSIYNNPGLYPQAFPWLFPYGLGGIGMSALSDKSHKYHLLMYHDKRFQRDPIFPFVAFSHQQLKAATSAGFLLADTSKFNDIASRLLSVNQDTLASVSKRLSDGEIVKPSTDDERSCFQIVQDLDHINGRVQGSITSKKYMRSEIWSLIAYMGAPIWYITLSPADNKHPICLYFADDNEAFDVKLDRSSDERFRLIANNPVAGARFFHFMIEAFIQHILGFGDKKRGLYGDTSAFYGTVEQQGRLTLHLHMLVWIRGALSPDEMRQRILDPCSKFREQLISYLEGTHAGDFMSASMDDVANNMKQSSSSEDCRDPTETLPEVPPPPCLTNGCCKCERCDTLSLWWSRFRTEVNTLLFKSNVHKCSTTRNKDGSLHKGRAYKGCLDNVHGKCKARFPRSVHARTEVDHETGSIIMKKTEQWLNTFSYVVTYLFRCNTDVTSLRSGTAIKSVLLYVTNYVTKVPLKTYAVFDTIRSIFERNPEVVGGSDSSKEKARKLLTKIVNSLSAKMEMGNPMICMYLLGNPDHYKSHKFRVIYWTSFVNAARRPWLQQDTFRSDGDTSSIEPGSSVEGRVEGDTANCDENRLSKEQVAIFKYKDSIVGLSAVDDYIYRSEALCDMNLYDWVARCERIKLPKVQTRRGTGVEVTLDDNGDGCSSRHVKTDHVRGSGVCHFLPAHPLANTHGTRCRPIDKECVPNFAGPTLPRYDQGDREFYCSAMLTLFKPWRTGLDLKGREETWDDAFSNYPFTERHVVVMKNMNIRYECLDARDDFYAQLRGTEAGIGSWEYEDIQTMQGNDDTTGEDAVNGIPDNDPLVKELCDLNTDVLGKREKGRCLLMSGIRTALRDIGWTEHVTDSSHPFTKDNVLAPEIKQNGAAWKRVITEKRAEVLEFRSQNISANSVAVPNVGAKDLCFIPDEVRIVDKSYISRAYVSKEWHDTIEDISSCFRLNAEQGRAFRIVVNHACSPEFEQLKMYIGGMAGTGKSQVLRALSEFFSRRKELHRLLILAPTGSAAALLGGSTYHSALGINSDGNRSSNVQLSQIKTRLIGVQYIFLDEVSMLSCRDMYLISERLARVLNRLDMPFGGMNMIFAGDFAQLPPAIGGEYASLYSRTAGKNATALKDQQAAIGKALWHQVTTVVLLRQNMRQRNESVEDTLFREVLSNMRYKSCTPEDIAFLKTRVSSNLPGKESVNDECFRNVSIITSLNALKDEINHLGSLRFAVETKQRLIDFFSIDSPTSDDVKDTREKKRTTRTMHRRDTTVDGKFIPNVQKLLWAQPPCTNSKLAPGKLSLCVGMPVMIRNNVATELCITKGQEAFIYGWQSQSINGTNTLDTLFVRLKDPPLAVKIDGLPLNVVPLTKNTVTTTCFLPDDSSVAVTRSQVDILPNFSMTDYASQGKTRMYNVVELGYTRTHQGYYTALSRGTSARGTLILGSFHPAKITGGASGALRQEFRELELLDDITTLRYENKLSMRVAMADRRKTIIAHFRDERGLQYMPYNLHRALRWNKRDPFIESNELPGGEIPWNIINAVQTKDSQHLSTIVACEVDSKTTTLMTKLELCRSSMCESNIKDIMCSKRERSDDSLVSHRPVKRHKRIVTDSTCYISSDMLDPIGTQWERNSCAYDAIITMLFNIWREDPNMVANAWNEIGNDHLDSLITSFNSHEYYRPSTASCTLENIRDIMRRRFSRLDDEFAFGCYTSVHAVMDRLLISSHPVMISFRRCRNNHAVDADQRVTNTCEIMTPAAPMHYTIQQYMDNFTTPSFAACRECGMGTDRSFSFVLHPPLIGIELWNGLRVLEPILCIDADGSRRRYNLRGVIYFSCEHFTARIVSGNGTVWFHDGIFTGRRLVRESTNISSIPTADSILALYIREDSQMS